MRSASLALSFSLVASLLVSAISPAVALAASSDDLFSSGDTQQTPPKISSNQSTHASDDQPAPMAPLPPAIVVGPIGIAMAGWAHYRMKRRRL